MRIVAVYYEMYSRAVNFVGPWIAKQSSNNIFLPPDKDTLKEALGRDRHGLSFRAKTAFIESLINHMLKYKGKKTLINPNPSSHHSAQFPAGTFSIERVELPVALRDDKGPRTGTRGPLHRIFFEGSPDPVYIEDLKIPADQVKFIILRPKLGKLGTPSTSRWEVLLYKQQHGYLIDHVDSDLNPRWSGIM
jgi:hypothetical protein